MGEKYVMDGTCAMLNFCSYVVQRDCKYAALSVKAVSEPGSKLYLFKEGITNGFTWLLIGWQDVQAESLNTSTLAGKAPRHV